MPFRKSRVVFLLVTGAVLHGTTAMSQEKPSESAKSGSARPQAEESRKEEREAIRKNLGSLIKAFEARDSKALASHWTEEGEYRNDASVSLRGRAEIEAAFAALFAATPEISAEIHPGELRFLSRDTAVGEGTVKVRRGAAEASTSAKYTSLLVREDGHWRLAQLSETKNDKVTIADLGWLVGEWKSTPQQGAEIRTTYSWAPSRKFLKVEFSLKEKDLELAGSQVLGVAPSTGNIRSWTFEGDGGVAEGDWSRDGDHWVIEASGTLADGTTITETNILRRVDADTFTWQSINRFLGDDEIDDLPPVKVTRVKSK
ncbi:MAG: nuclear transport factor 2 family protein [Planctomycetaceae bacterium]|nr:nuclear transport factor 2 family protein [Planctomycetaceae bacterium]